MSVSFSSLQNFCCVFSRLGMVGVFWAVRIVSESGLKQTSNLGHSSLI